MINYDEIESVHLELSSMCNANCPGCPRNYYGYPYNDGYVERNLTLSNVKAIFRDINFIKQLKRLRIEGNFGDFVSNNESIDIIKYFLQFNPELKVRIVTNGSAQKVAFWKELGELGVTVVFSIDGLEDTHKIYRQSTNFNKIISNAKAFINAGGKAHCKTVVFEHNKHQIEDIKQLTEDLGFVYFEEVNNTRGAIPAFNRRGTLVNKIDGYSKTIDLKQILENRKTDEVLLEDVAPFVKEANSINCEICGTKEIYIDSVGDVYPCCYLGFNPRKYGNGNYHQPVNKQIRKIIHPNNAVRNRLENCIKWFKNVEQSWIKATIEDAKLVACIDNCGVNK